MDENKSEEETAQGSILRKSTRATFGKKPDRFGQSVCYANEVEKCEPKSFEDAINRSDKQKWLAAMEDELKSIEANKTWTLVDLPKGRTAVGSKWVFKLKRDVNGNVSRYKARLVARGFSQKFGIDYDEVFAPVVRIVTFRMLLAIAARNKMKVKHFDIKAAFLNGEIQEEIYLQQPPGFQQGNKVGRLHKSLYGLKQAARSWNSAIHNVLTRIVLR